MEGLSCITLDELTSRLLLPLLRLLATMAIGLLAAHVLEALRWTRFVARLATPLVRTGRLGEVAGASFALAFFSPASSNALLAEAYGEGRLSRRELLLTNLFNSTPSFLVHLPTLFSLIFAFLGTRAFIYIGLTFAAACLRTLCTLVAGRLLLPEAPPPAAGASREKWGSRGIMPLAGESEGSRTQASGAEPPQCLLPRTLARFRKRLWRLALITVPVYCLVFAAQQAGYFTAAQAFMAERAGALPFLNPQSLSIVTLHLLAESGAALSAAAALAHSGSLSTPEIVMALLVGSIVSSPLRALRHQFPSYAGFFTPRLAFLLVVSNQCCRALSLAIVAILYYYGCSK